MMIRLIFSSLRHLAPVFIPGFLAVALSCESGKALPENSLRVVGAMKKVMWEGRLEGTISLDSLEGREHLYGLGPMEGLSGEWLILDGEAFQSVIQADSTMKVVRSFEGKAPFFAYGSVFSWKPVALPGQVVDHLSLEAFLDKQFAERSTPFFFRLTGMVDTAHIHVVNLPPGTVVRSPQEAHQGQRNFTISGQACEVLGFYSTKHQAIFTHHDTHLHMHLLTKDRLAMGHLESMTMQPGSFTLEIAE